MNYNLAKYCLVLLLLGVLTGCDDNPEEISGTRLVIKIEESPLIPPYMAKVGDELNFIVEGNAEFYSIWPGSTFQAYEDYGKVNEKGKPAAGISLSKNDRGNFSGSFVYNTPGNYALTIIGRTYNYKAAKMNEVILKEQIVINDTIPE